MKDKLVIRTTPRPVKDQNGKVIGVDSIRPGLYTDSRGRRYRLLPTGQVVRENPKGMQQTKSGGHRAND